MILSIKKAKGTKKCAIKRRFMLKSYKDCLFNDKIILQSQQRFKSDHHNVYTGQMNRIIIPDHPYKCVIKFNKEPARY